MRVRVSCVCVCAGCVCGHGRLHTAACRLARATAALTRWWPHPDGRHGQGFGEAGGHDGPTGSSSSLARVFWYGKCCSCLCADGFDFCATLRLPVRCGAAAQPVQLQLLPCPVLPAQLPLPSCVCVCVKGLGVPLPGMLFHDVRAHMHANACAHMHAHRLTSGHT